MTSLPSGSRPAASQPSTIGSRSAEMPTPRSVHTSWWLSEAALTVTVTHPSGATGSGRSPSSMADSGSSASRRAAVTANTSDTLSGWTRRLGEGASGGLGRAGRNPMRVAPYRQVRVGEQPVGPRHLCAGQGTWSMRLISLRLQRIVTVPHPSGWAGRGAVTRGARVAAGGDTTVVREKKEEVSGGPRLRLAPAPLRRRPPRGPRGRRTGWG